MGMTPHELVQLTISRAKEDLHRELARLEFIYWRPAEVVDEGLVECFLDFCCKHLATLCLTYRKRHKGISNRKVVIGDDRFYFERLRGEHLFLMNHLEPIYLRWIPNDIDVILIEFSAALHERNSLVEDVLTSYKIERKAGEIAKTTIGILLGDELTKSGYALRVLCSNDGSWDCILHSEDQQKSIAFISTPQTIKDDVIRIISVHTTS